jgi:hypothetical protein
VSERVQWAEGCQHSMGICATVYYRAEEFVAAPAVASEWRLGEFNGQEVANTAWAFARVNRRRWMSAELAPAVAAV